MDRNFKGHFCGKAVRTAGFLPILMSIFCLNTEHMCRIVGGKSWHFHPLPAVRGGCYGASGGHLLRSKYPNALFYHITGCEFSGAQKLLALAPVEGNSSYKSGAVRKMHATPWQRRGGHARDCYVFWSMRS